MSLPNKLKKLPPSSTNYSPMNYGAISQYPQQGSSSRTMTLAMNSISTPTPLMNVQQMTSREQLWAVRALKAETLLNAQEAHKNNVMELGRDHDMKRERELSSLAKNYKEKNAALERIIVYLVVLVLLLLAVVIYLSTSYTRQAMLLLHNQQGRWWSAIGTSHFTIPILSPFTSVVEQETSVIGAKVLGTLAAVTACLVYFMFRHWLGRKILPQASTATMPFRGASHHLLNTG